LSHYSSVVYMRYYPRLLRLQPYIYAKAMTTPRSQDSVLSFAEMKRSQPTIILARIVAPHTL
jgi:hypothetical protein